MTIFERLLELIAPHQCLGCGAEGSLLCESCRNAIVPVSSRCYACSHPTDAYKTCHSCGQASDLSQVWAATPYDGLAKELIHKLKFGRAKIAAKDMADIMAHRIPPGDWLVTYVPTANARVRLRGYDQAQCIAKQLAGMLGLVYTPLLVRQGSRRQLGQNRSSRKTQMQTAFRTTWNEIPQNKPILIIDDVLTTGATLEAAAHALKSAGAQNISAAVFAAA
ncbi:MAG TPA: phosphoribosyltransferase family protein [Patescibacteria group bacterium]|nr:phosphoribosyltransferase family protein [Patescibacteria group bacterium]